MQVSDPNWDAFSRQAAEFDEITERYQISRVHEEAIREDEQRNHN